MARLCDETGIARAYNDDDLRRKLLASHDRSEGSLRELAARFGVSEGWAWKISAQRKRSGHPERVRHRPGRKPRAGAQARRQVVEWVHRNPDLTLVEIQSRLASEAQVQLSRGRIWYLVRGLGRLKKSHSTPRSGTRRRTARDAKSSSKASASSRRRN